MKTPIFWAMLLVLMAGQAQATVFSISNGLFDHYAVSASDVVGSGYIRFYGPTNDDYNAVFTGWLVTETTPGDPILSDSGYPAYDSIEALDLERKAGTYDEIRPELAATEEDAYTLLLSYAVNPICVGDVHSAICGDPGKDIKVTVSSTVMNESSSNSP